jgi:putative hemolysin
LTAGPLVIISNHPFGIIDGLILGGVAKKNGLNFKIMANYMLSSIAERIKQDIIGIDPYDNAVSIKRNLTPLKQAFNWLKNGNTMILFPAGDVANFSLSKMKIIEGPWPSSIERLIKGTKANVLPIYFEGRNSILFYLLKCIHLKLGTFRLLHEFFNKSGTVIKLHVGEIIRYNELDKVSKQQSLIDFLRQTTISLGSFSCNPSQE